MALIMSSVRSGAVLDTVTLDGDRLAYDTGTARSMLEGLRTRRPGPPLSDADLYRLAPGLTNTHVIFAEQDVPG